jgi:hypothetical protein
VKRNYTSHPQSNRDDENQQQHGHGKLENQPHPN